MGNKRKAVKASACWISKPSQNLSNKGNISYLSDYEPFDRGYVSFGQGGCKITGKGTIKTECIVLGRDFKLIDDTNVLLRTPRRHNMYFVDLNNIVPHKYLTCLVAKASADECMLWHRRLGNQHKASCKTKLVNSVTKPLHTLHMDLFGPTSDETSGILRNFIIEIENPKELRVKIIRCDNQGEFRNKEMNDFCSMKGKFDANRDEGYFIGYSMSSKGFRVFNKRTKRVEENLHVDFLENKAIVKCIGPNWLFDIDSLTKSMNYVPVVVAGINSTNFSGTKEAAGQDVKKDVSSLRYIALPNWVHEALLESSSSNAQDTCDADASESSGNPNPTATKTNPPADQMETLTVETPIPTISSPAHLETSTSNAQDACNTDAPESSGNSNPTATSINPPADHMEILAVETPIPNVSSSVPSSCLNDSLEPSSDTISKRVTSQDDTPSLDNILTLTNRFEDILGVTTNTDDTNGVEADPGNVETTITASPTPTLRIHKDHPKIYQIDVKSAFLYGTIDEEVYVMQPLGFQDPEFPARVYKVEKAMYGLHQAPRAWYDVRSSNTPIDKENPWGKDRTRKDVDLHLYISMIRSLMYLTVSRPDIMFAICACARHQVTPKECYMHAVKRIFRYIKGHPKLGLWYPKESPFDTVAYSDSDYGVAS
nr:ribonuclease H-like domain-containing protein [Tanacetum cinerariifolium]